MTPPDVVVTEDLQGAGALTYWSLSGPMNPALLADEWELADELLPEPPTPAVALARAMKGSQGRHRLVRTLGRGTHAVIAETVRGEDVDPEYSVDLKVKLDVTGRPVCVPADHPAGPAIATAYQEHLKQCSAEDIGSWLCWLVRRFDGVALRESGGFYFIPPQRLDEWRAIVAALRAVSAHRVHVVPAMRTEEAVEAILAAVEAEATAAATAVEQELAGEELGLRALQNRSTSLDALQSKVARYEATLGARIEGFRERLETLRAGVAAATLRAESSGNDLREFASL
jgi:hypothetical protein